MSSSNAKPRPATQTTEVTLVTGARFRVQGDLESVQRIIVDAARGSIMQLAMLVGADTRDDLAVNPEHVVLLRPAGSCTNAAPHHDDS